MQNAGGGENGKLQIFRVRANLRIWSGVTIVWYYRDDKLHLIYIVLNFILISCRYCESKARINWMYLFPQSEVVVHVGMSKVFNDTNPLSMVLGEFFQDIRGSILQQIESDKFDNLAIVRINPKTVSHGGGNTGTVVGQQIVHLAFIKRSLVKGFHQGVEIEASEAKTLASFLQVLFLELINALGRTLLLATAVVVVAAAKGSSLALGFRGKGNVSPFYHHSQAVYLVSTFMRGSLGGSHMTTTSEIILSLRSDDGRNFGGSHTAWS